MGKGTLVWMEAKNAAIGKIRMLEATSQNAMGMHTPMHFFLRIAVSFRP